MLLSLAMLSPVLAASDGEHIDVTIRDYRFEPADITITRGATVRWTNREKRTSHSILFVDATIGESERLFPDEHWEWTFDAPGVYPYRCGPHEEMHGSVTVTD